MTFPNGKVKDGMFDNNTFLGKTTTVKGSQAYVAMKLEVPSSLTVKKQSSNTSGMRTRYSSLNISKSIRQRNPRGRSKAIESILFSTF